MVPRTLIIAIAAVIASPALAQAPPHSKLPVTPAIEHNSPAGCADTRATVGEGGNDVQMTKPQDKTLSDKLAQSNGVICPPHSVDPGLKKPTPPQGSMPVIPPPGTPGGNQQIQPK